MTYFSKALKEQLLGHSPRSSNIDVLGFSGRIPWIHQRIRFGESLQSLFQILPSGHLLYTVDHHYEAYNFIVYKAVEKTCWTSNNVDCDCCYYKGMNNQGG